MYKDLDISFVEKNCFESNKEISTDKQQKASAKLTALEKERKEVELKYKNKVFEYNEFINKHQRDLVTQVLKQSLNRIVINSGE